MSVDQPGRLEEVILDENFPELDLALRRGRHVHRDDERWYAFLSEGQAVLEGFYRRYGCELVHRSDGYFFLLPVTDALGKRHLTVAEMIVGQGLALAYLDPRAVQKGGVITREELLGQLAAVMGTDALMNTFNPKRKRPDERVMQRTVRQKVNEALRRLSQLGFVELLEGEQLRLPPSLMRFAEPVKGLDAPSEALKQLLERGEVSLGPGDADGEASLPGDEDGVHDGAFAQDGLAEEEGLADADELTRATAFVEGDELAEGEEDDAPAEDEALAEDQAPADAMALRDAAANAARISLEDLDLDWDKMPDEEA
jgi:chromosome partition protein MukE